MMNAIYNRKRYRVVDDIGSGVVLSPTDAGSEQVISYDDELLVLDPTDSEWELAGEGGYHHQDEWANHLCCQ